MKVLLHYTITKNIFEYFEQDEYEFINSKRIEEVKKFYEKYNRSQDNLFFIVCFTDNNIVKYQIGKISLNKNGKLIYNKVSMEISNLIIKDLGIANENTYEMGIFYKEYWLENNKTFIDKKMDYYLSKIKLRFFNWEELLANNDILFRNLIKLIFNENNVFKIATTYNPDINYEQSTLRKKYYSALQSIGFINKDEININNTHLHGDIGEFLMHTLISIFMKSRNVEKYIFPKLVFKTNPKMPVYGNDGTIYIPEKKEIYYMEAKFYGSLADAITSGIDSLLKHNEACKENIDHNVELFRNIKTNRINEVVEITKDVKEKLILFLMCDDMYMEADLKKCVEKNEKLIKFKSKFDVIIFILPVLSKEKFLSYFKSESSLVGEEWYGRN